MRIYLDLVMLLNFLVDLLLLLGTNRLAGFPSEMARMLSAAALGSIYSGVCMLSGLRFLGSTLWRIVCLALMACMAFGWNRSTLKRGGIFVLLSMALGGIAMGFGKSNPAVLILAASGVWLLCRIAFGGSVGQQCYTTVEIRYGERTVSMIALRDTGNTLRDPITGDPVMVISATHAERLTGLTYTQLSTPLETLARRPIPGLRLIPYKAIGQAGSMLLAMRFEDVRIGSKRQSAVVAFAAEGLETTQMYQALIGGAL